MRAFEETGKTVHLPVKSLPSERTARLDVLDRGDAFACHFSVTKPRVTYIFMYRFPFNRFCR
jgi:hypothetical protein